MTDVTAGNSDFPEKSPQESAKAAQAPGFLRGSFFHPVFFSSFSFRSCSRRFSAFISPFSYFSIF